MTRRAYIGLGANLGQPAEQLHTAFARISELGRLVATSPLYRSAPMGPVDQPDFCNAVCALDTGLEPQALLDALLAIERACGRVRDGHRWGPRILDLDLLHVEGVQLDTPTLRLPHPGIAARNWVLAPWCDIAPDLVVPGIGGIANAAAAMGRAGLAPWDAA